eukprot:5820986-Amphidinium_carterae.1
MTHRLVAAISRLRIECGSLQLCCSASVMRRPARLPISASMCVIAADAYDENAPLDPTNPKQFK